MLVRKQQLELDMEQQAGSGTTEDAMVGWHHWHNGHGFGWTLGVGDGQGGLACCGSWGRKESDMTELNWIVVPYPVLTVASWPAYRFLKRQVRRSGIPISWKIFHSLLWSLVEGFGIVNKAEIDVFLELSCFFDDPADIGHLFSDSFSFSKTSLNIWKFMVHILLKPGLKDFEDYFTSVCDECNCMVVWAFFVSSRGTKKKSDFLSRVDWVQRSFPWNCIDMQLVKPGPVSGQRLACLQWFILYQPYIFLPQKMSTFSGLKGCGL